MQRENYAPWDLSVGQFPKDGTHEDQLRFLVGFLVLAPSSHNAQPWKVWIRGDRLYIGKDSLRILPISDPNDRQTYISIGCALENFLTAADYFGVRASRRYFPEEEPGAAVALDCEFGGSMKNESNHLVFSIPKRSTNRSKYQARLGDNLFVENLRAASDEDIRIHVIGTGEKKNRIARIASDALISAMDIPGFRKELSVYIESNITRSKTGMPMFGFGMPTLLSFFAKLVLGRYNVNRLSEKQDLALLTDHTPFFVVISTRVDSPEYWMRAGRTFEHIALEAERKGISCAPSAAIVQIGDFYKQLMQELETDFRPQFFFRIGYPTAPARHSPRLSVNDVLVP